MSFQMLSESRPTARKVHRCEWCGENIEAGETYYRYSGVFEGYFQNTALHLECEQAMRRDIAEKNDYDYLLPDDVVRGKTSWETEEAQKGTQNDKA